MNILEARRRTLGADVYKKTVQGNPVSARSLARMRPGLKVFGKSEQFTTTGAQLIPFELGAEMTSINGVTKCIPKKDGFRIELNGTSNQTAEFDIRFVGGYKYFEEDSYDEYENLPAGTYYAKISDNRFILNVIAWRGTNITLISTSTGGSFEVQDGDKFRIFIRPSPSAVDATVKAIISKQNDSVMYEPYTGGKPSPSTDYPQEITSAGDDGEIEVTIANDGYVEKGTAFDDVKKIPLLKGSYVYLKSNIGANKINAFVVDDPNLIETIGGNNFNSNILYSYCVTQLGISSMLPDGSAISGDARLSASWGNGVKYKIEQDGLYLYYANNNRVNDDAENTFVWFLDHEGSKDRPYATQPLIVSTPNGLPGIPVTSGGNYTDSTGQQWICDEIDFCREKYVQRVKKEYLTGTPNFQKSYDSVKHKWSNALTNSYKSGNSAVLSTFGIYSAWANPIEGNEVICIVGHNLYWSTPTEMTAEEANTKFSKMIASDNPPYVIGQLETPIETDLTPEQMDAYVNLHTNRPTTVVSATDGAGLELTYKTKKSLEVN